MKQILLLISIILITGSCGNKIDKDIDQVMNKRNTAFVQKDTDLYSSILSDNYLKKSESGEEKKEQAIKNFKVNTTPFDTVRMKHKNRTAYIEGDTAKVVQNTNVVLDIDGKKNNFETTEIVFLKKEGNSWKITKESELDLFRGFVFGSN